MESLSWVQELNGIYHLKDETFCQGGDSRTETQWDCFLLLPCRRETLVSCQQEVYLNPQ